MRLPLGRGTFHGARGGSGDDVDCIAIIPARFDSTRFPGKALASLAGRPLIQHVIERCARVTSVREVVVATDDERIASAAREAGAEAVLTPAELPSGTDRVAAVAAGLDCDVVLNVQGDEPLIDPQELDRAVRSFVASAADYATLRAPLREARDLWDPNVVKVAVDVSGRALYFSRGPIPFPRAECSGAAGAGAAPRVEFTSAPELPGPYWVHVGVYLYRRRALLRWARIAPSALERAEGLEQLRLLEAGETIWTYEVGEAVPGVDTEEDLERVRKALAGG